MENAVIEEWIKKNTFKCPALNARISLKQCEEIRSRPSFDDYVKGLISLPKRKTIKSFRPRECDKCKIWEEFAMSKEKDKKICKMCGAEFKPYKLGCVDIHNFCEVCIRKKMLENRKKILDVKKLKTLFNKYDLWGVLIEKAEQSVRSIEEQIVYELMVALLENSKED